MGGDGCISGGRLDKSRDKFDFRRFAAGTGETGRESMTITSMMSLLKQNHFQPFRSKDYY